MKQLTLFLSLLAFLALVVGIVPELFWGWLPFTLLGLVQGVIGVLTVEFILGVVLLPLFLFILIKKKRKEQLS